MKDNAFKMTLKEKILFFISIVLLSNGFTLPVGVIILLGIFLRIGMEIMTYSKDIYPNTDFVN
ncbi:MAG: hypothetical protein EXS75_03685 [Nitrosarchaeum sp.]|nr:hypothetical protein [Nitrosarchaeum sp.]